MTIPANMSSGSGTFLLNPSDDEDVEGPETLIVSGIATGLNVIRATLQLIDNDLPRVSIEPLYASVEEGNPATFILGRNRGLHEALVVSVVVTQQGDFINGTPPMTVTFPYGRSAVNLEVPTEDDIYIERVSDLSSIYHPEALENDGSVTATIGQGAGYLLVSGSSGSATVRVEENDRPLITMRLPSEIEGFNELQGRMDEGENFAIYFNRVGNDEDRLTVNFTRTANCYSIPSGLDQYTHPSFPFSSGVSGEIQSVTLGSGVRRLKYIRSTVNEDIHDCDTRVTLRVQSSTSYYRITGTYGAGEFPGDPTNTFDYSSAVIVVNNDDARPSLTIANAQANENDGTIEFTAVFGGSRHAWPIAIAWEATSSVGDQSSTATAGVDYGNGAQGTFSFEALEQGSREFTVPIIDDRIDEKDETFFIKLSVIGAESQGEYPRRQYQVNINNESQIATGTIIDNDLTTFSVHGRDFITEGETARFGIRPNGSLSTDVTVNYTVETTGDYFASPPPATGSLSWDADESAEKFIEFSTSDDETDEEQGLIKVSIQPSASYNIDSADSTHTTQISDNDRLTVFMHAKHSSSRYVVSLPPEDALPEGGTATLVFTRNSTSNEPLELRFAYRLTPDMHITDDIYGEDVIFVTPTIPAGQESVEYTVEIRNDNYFIPQDYVLWIILYGGEGYPYYVINTYHIVNDVQNSGTDRVQQLIIPLTDNDTVQVALYRSATTRGEADGYAEFYFRIENLAPVRSFYEHDFRLPVSLSVTQQGEFLGTPVPSSVNIHVYPELQSGQNRTHQNTTFRIPLDDDNVDEPDGSVTVAVVNGNLYEGVTGKATVTTAVTDDDDPPTGVHLSLSSTSISEGSSGEDVTVTARLEGSALAEVTTVLVEVGGSSDTADEGTDYATVDAITVTIAANQPSGTATFMLSPVNDDVDEDNETITVSGATTDLTVTPASITITITDDDTRGVTVSERSLTLSEGGSEIYTVVLTSQPTAAVTVSVSGDSDVTVNNSSLTFTTSDWSTAQTVTVSAAEDNDGVHDSATLTHTATGGGYNGISEDLSLTVTDDDHPVITIASGDDVVEGNDAVFTLSRSGSLISAVTVVVSISEVNQVVADDEEGDRAVSFLANSATMSFSVPTVADAVREPSSVVSATIQDRDAYDVGDPARASLDVHDSNIFQNVSLSTSTPRVNEGVGTITFSVEAVTTGDTRPNKPTSFEYRTASGTATQDEDFLHHEGTRLHLVQNHYDVFDDNGQMRYRATREFSISIEDDAIPEGLEDFTVSLVYLRGLNASVNPDEVTVTIEDNDAILLSIDNATGAENAGALVFPVTLNRTSSQAVTVTYATSGVTATAGADYTETGDTLIFGTTETDRTIRVSLIDDPVDEGDETFTLTLSNVQNAVFADAATSISATGTITDDDTRGVRVTPTSLPVAEGGSEIYTVVLTSEPTAAVTVSVSESGDSDVRADESSLTFTTSDWSTAQTVTVSAAEDGDVLHGTATITHTVSSSGDYSEETAASVDVTEQDNDTASTAVVLSVSPSSVSESSSGQTVTVTGTLNEGTRANATTVSVQVGKSGDSAIEGTDYTTVDAITVTIAANQASGTATFTLSPVNDDVDEANETVSVSGTTTNSLTVDEAEVTITDDDTRGVRVTPTSLPVAEGGSETYTVVLTSEPTAAVTVNMIKSGDSDVTVDESSLTFTTSDWSTAQTVTVRAVEDGDALHGTATISHSVSSSGDYSGETASSVSVTERDNDSASTGVTLRVSPSSVSESSRGQMVTVTGTLNGGTRADATTVSVQVGKSGDSAIEGTDYTTVDAISVTIAANQVSGEATFTLNPVNDDVDEENETVSVSGTTTNSLTVDEAEVTITDDDTRDVRVNPTSLSVGEGGSETYTVVLTSEPTASVMVNMIKSGDSDVTVDESSLTFTTSDWSTAQTVTVSAAEDGDALAGTATITHTVSSSGDYAGETASSVDVTERDNDTATTTVVLSVSPSSVSESSSGQTVTVTGTLNGGARADATTVVVSVGSGSATSVTDFASVAAITVTIAANQPSGTATFMLSPVNDTIDETDETVSVSGTTTNGLSVTSASVTIIDDDAPPPLVPMPQMKIFPASQIESVRHMVFEVRLSKASDSCLPGFGWYCGGR